MALDSIRPCLVTSQSFSRLQLARSRPGSRRYWRIDATIKGKPGIGNVTLILDQAAALEEQKPKRIH
jgi:hypothetical protein